MKLETGPSHPWIESKHLNSLHSFTSTDPMKAALRVLALTLALTLANSTRAENNMLRALDANAVATSNGSISPWKLFGDPAVASATASLADLPTGASAKIVLNNTYALAGILQRVSASASRGKVLTLRGRLKVSGPDEHSVGLWLRTDDENGNTISLENMSDSRLVGTTQWLEERISLYVPENAHWIRAGVLIRGAGTVEIANLDLQQIEEAQDPVDEERPRAPANALLQEFVGLVEKHSLRFSESYRPKMLDLASSNTQQSSLTPREFRDLAKLILQGMGDFHSTFQVGELESRSTQNKASKAPISLPTLSAVSASVSLLKLPAIQTFDAAEAIQYARKGHAALLASRARCGLIVDLRENSGGNMWPMLAAISPVLPTGVIGGFVDREGKFEGWVNKGGRMHLDQDLMLAAKHRVNRVTSGHIAVLMGPATASSGEAVAIALSSIPGTASFGQATAGLTTGNRLFNLSDGTAILLESSRFAKQDRKPYRGPVIPDHQFDNTGALQASVEWLMGKCKDTK